MYVIYLPSAVKMKPSGAPELIEAMLEKKISVDQRFDKYILENILRKDKNRKRKSFLTRKASRLRES